MEGGRGLVGGNGITVKFDDVRVDSETYRVEGRAVVG